VLSFSLGISQEVNFQIDENSWQADFKFLKNKVEKIVPSYQNPKNKKAFDEMYGLITSSQIGNDKLEIVYTIQKLLNTLNDEGCNVPLFQEGVALEVLPIKTYWFNDGLYVLDAVSNYNDIIGEQIVEVNGIAVDDVFSKLKPFINADNDYYKKHLFQAYGFMPSALKILELGKSDNEISLQFKSGKTIVVESSSINDYSQLSRGLPNDGVFNLTNKDYKGKNYWSEMLPNTKTLFVQMQRIANNEAGESFSSFINDIESLIEADKTNKIVLDLRYGGGGNGFKLKKFTDLLRESNTINKTGNLFVLTSKATRGTLLELASILRLNTKAILIGEPTAEGVNTVGDTKYITLPNSGIRVSLTHTFWPTSWQKDISTFISPDEGVAYNYSNKVKEQDPWLDVVNNYKVNEASQSVPSELINQLIGTYKIEGRKISIENTNGKLFLIMNRKMKSFFEIHTELYYQSEGVLSTDIDGVMLTYATNSSNKTKLESLNWKGLNLNIQ
jgi:hypothetical protein